MPQLRGKIFTRRGSELNRIYRNRWKGLLNFVVLLAGALFVSSIFDLGPQIEKMLGRSTAAEMKSTFGYVQFPLLNRYVNQIGTRMAAVAERKSISYTYAIIHTEEENAFAAGAGYTFITTGMLKMADTEDEVAGILGHETGHNSDKHVIQAVKDQFGVLALYLALEPKMSEDQQVLYGVLATLRSLRYSRKDEYRADDLGVRYSARTGYNPYYLITSFEKLEAAHPTGKLSKLEVALSSHPRTPDRINRIRGQIRNIQEDPNQSASLGKMLLARGFYQESLDFLEPAEKRSPDNAEILLALAEAYQVLGKADQAKEKLLLARASNPSADLPPIPASFTSQVTLPSPSSYSDDSILLAYSARGDFLSGLVDAERSALQTSLDYLDSLAMQNTRMTEMQRSLFRSAVAATEQLEELYASDNAMRRLVQKTEVLLQRTRNLPAFFPSELSEATACLLDASDAWGDRSKETSSKVKDAVLAFSGYTGAPLDVNRNLRMAEERTRTERERRKAALSRAYECSSMVYSLRLSDIFYALEERYPGTGMAYLAEKTGLSRDKIESALRHQPRVGYMLAGYNLSLRHSPPEKTDVLDFYAHPIQAETEKENLWTYLNLVAGDLYRLYAGPMYQATLLVEVKTPEK